MPIRFAINTRSDVVARSYDAYALAAGERRRKGALFVAALALALLGSAWMGEVDPARLLRDFHKFPAYLGSIVPTLRWDSLGADFAEWYWGIGRWSGLLLETLMIAYVGTVLGFIGGFILCFPASSNLVRSRWVVFLARRTLEIQRTVPEIVFALIFVVAFGLGPLAGVLAIAIHTTGALGKLFAEVNENVDLRPIEGVQAAGGGWLQAMRFAVVPQVASNFASYALLRFEINVRGASVLGFVGAGGIGQELLTTIRQFYYPDISAVLLMIIATVMLVDIGTERLRHHLLHLEHGR
jgi:phosphonate transport system permease protein